MCSMLHVSRLKSKATISIEYGRNHKIHLQAGAALSLTKVSADALATLYRGSFYNPPLVFTHNNRNPKADPSHEDDMNLPSNQRMDRYKTNTNT